MSIVVHHLTAFTRDIQLKDSYTREIVLTAHLVANGQ